MTLYFFILIIGVFTVVINGAVIANNDDVSEQGLYGRPDGVVILTDKNFDKKIYGQKNAYLVQFYNSYCGHCRAFAPKFKNLASELIPWQNIIKLAAIDCSVEENNEICRRFEVMAYPTLRYIRENYKKSNANVGDKFLKMETIEKLKINLISKMQNEQKLGFLTFSPSLSIAAYASYSTALRNIPTDTIYTFLVFENENSTLGSELVLDLSSYSHIIVKRVYDNSELAEIAGIRKPPGLVAVKSNYEPTLLSTSTNGEINMLGAIKTFLKSNNYEFPVQNIDTDSGYYLPSNDNEFGSTDSDIVYYSDLEMTIKNSLHTEITRYKILNGEPLQALLNYLDILIFAFPFKKNNLKEYLIDLRNNLNMKNEWNGGELYDLVKMLETTHSPVYSPDIEYFGCKGSQPKYRGYTCGLWTLFHTLTVNAVDKPGLVGPIVLQAMHSYVKHFFGCTDCSEHFQDMAAKNKIFDVKENDKAVLWLWISHNKVNLRLAGDLTEDPQHPKIQFPSVKKCPECRLSRGAWNLAAVYEYLLKTYSASNIQTTRRARSAAEVPSSFSNLDIGMLSLLYILSLILLILAIRYFVTKHFFRKRRFKRSLGKV